MLLARVVRPGAPALAVANLHASTGEGPGQAHEVERAAERACEWAGQLPLLFGGDLNLRPARAPELFARLSDRHGLRPATGPAAIDHLLARGLEPLEGPRALRAEEREVEGPHGLALRLSDHAPVVAAFGMR